MANQTPLTEEKMSSFNIALFPEDEQFISHCIKLAQANFSNQAEEYLLGDGAWPHITLCQFTVEPTRLTEIWSAVSPLIAHSLSVHLAQFYIWLYENKYWVGLGTKRESELISLQLSVYETLTALGIKGNQTPSNYFPHITWARCSGEKPPVITALPPVDFWFKPAQFALSLGESSPYGVYRRRLFPGD